MAYKFQLGAARLSGSTTFEQPLVVEDSFNANSLSSSGDLSVGGDVRIDGATAVTVTNTDQLYFRDSDGTVKMDEAQDVRDLFFSAVSGDATIAAGGALTIGAGAVEHGMLAEDIISGQAELAHADINDADDMLIDDAGTVKKVGVDSLRDHFFGVVSGDATIADGGALTIAADSVEGTMLNTNAADGTTLGLTSDSLSVLKVPNALSQGDGIAAFSYDGSGALTVALSASVGGAGLAYSSGVLSLDIDELSALGGAGVAQGDHFVFSDDGTEKKITFSNLEDAIFGNISGDATVAAGGALTIAADSVEGTMLNTNAADGTTLGLTSDSLSVLKVPNALSQGDGIAAFSYDGSGALTVALSASVGGEGLAYSSGVLKLDMNELTAATVNVANDSIAIIDADDSNASKKESIADFVASIASAAAGMQAASGQLGVNSGDGLKINGSNELVVEPANFAGTGLEDDGSDNLRIAASAAGDGLSGGSGSALALDLNELTAATVDVSADSIAIIDADASNGSRKESIADLASGMAGAGLAASGGQLSIPNNGVTEKDFSDDFTAVVGYNVPDANAMGKAIVVTMPAPQLGAKVTIKAPPSCSSTFTITISGASMDGATSLVLEGPGAAVSLVNVSEGGDVWIIV